MRLLGLTTMAAVHAAPTAVAKPAEALKAASYVALPVPIPNASTLLMAHDVMRAQARSGAQHAVDQGGFDAPDVRGCRITTITIITTIATRRTSRPAMWQPLARLPQRSRPTRMQRGAGRR